MTNGFRHFGVNTTTSEQYEPFRQLIRKYPGVIVPSFGIHPCFVDRQQQINVNEGKVHMGWLVELRQVLMESKEYCVGEIGIDFRTAVLERIPKEPQL